ncbi:alpha/beta fold hydrolase [Acinetobacter genomosp. 15BJ]|uniref:Alpha/beta hydrolase n=1 Tax=Acinetobacter genomosp. 15BJ TaxID=106651 RepID=A0ABT8V4A1_9GAMM|nr:hypothetical protein [Acinetobacter genomosp. 15BJ]MCH7290140.1 hypothetical protein [Acinetobacter genomosp. 15BJ]MDO3658729.1 hypothetical protein [Acinetobacter genomosp. 15BJ]
MIHGTEDLLIPIACGQDSTKSISGAELLKIEGMGHDLPTDLDQLIIDAIAAHIQQAMPHKDQ